MSVVIIAAIAKNRGIGRDNDLPWSLPDDMKFFKTTTNGRSVIMGRKNFESIPHKYRPLPNRQNIIVTRKDDYKAEGCTVVNSIEEGIEKAEREGDIFIIGGGQIYADALENNLVDEMLLTEVQAEIEADVFFPKFDKSEWREIKISEHEKDEKHDYSFVIKKYVKK
jgi:dihydrofolate reductase